MAYNMHYMEERVFVTVDRVYDHTFNDEYLIANYGGKYALNSLHGRVINIQEADGLEIKESWSIQDILKNQEK